MERVKASMTASQVGIKNVIVVAWHYKRFFNLLTDMLAIINPIWYAGGGGGQKYLPLVLFCVFKKIGCLKKWQSTPITTSLLPFLNNQH